MGIFHTLFSRRSRAAAAERRKARRSRTRLRPGKLLDADLAFLGDCAILDRSARGLRLRLFENPVAESGVVAVLDENEGSVRYGRIVWRQDGEAGVHAESEPEPIDPAALRRLAGPYYAVRD
ncbi:hypothetical protein [Aureimonas leprariae]|uniref:PilZ domain-containing protein n=1 Tax=Plantimonas leprariae TaxID=2615207 RepID=A0A7V7PPE8_9HYPH|nr:hypothetical protein [Aureimonas leprariae]KAB0679883.1 hypothetical protein F6X38_11710 [Aureimonas leprariae]